MTRTVLVAGTASHVGKSTVATGLCRHLADRGVDVAPFKAQNMSNNARVAPSVGATDAAYGEIGVAQHTQARAARTPATTDHNPVLLKPRGGGESELVLDGVAVADCSAGAYYDRHWRAASRAARRAHDRLRADHDLVVAEGAGSIGEVNLHDRDLANVETARFGDAAVVLVTDIDRGGAFGSLVGTLELLPDDVRERVVGAVITKFRGDRSLLAPGIETVQERTGVPVLGVVPHDDPGLPAEDSLSLPDDGEDGVWDGGTASERGRHASDSSTATAGGTSDDGRPLVVGAMALPRVSNATDLAPLAEEPGVVVRWIPPGDSLAGCDAVVVPGTKNTVDDARALADAGAFETLRRFDGPIVGLCGGYQLLGERLTDADVEGLGDAGTIPAAGLLPVETQFEPTKTVRPVERSTTGAGPLDGVETTVRGYEIHAGSTSLLDDVARPFPDAGATTGRVLGTYVHDLFATRAVRRGFLRATARAAGRDLHIDHDPAVHDPADQTAAGPTPTGPTPTESTPADPCDAAATLVADHVDLGPLAEAVAVDLQPGANSESRS